MQPVDFAGGMGCTLVARMNAWTPIREASDPDDDMGLGMRADGCQEITDAITSAETEVAQMHA
jgi:hypothetical protein